MAFKTHIDNSTGNQPGTISPIETAVLSEGVHDLLRGDFLVSGKASLAVDIAKGEAFIHNDSYVYGSMDQRMFAMASSATETVAVTSNSSGNPRIDIVCIKIDTAASPGTQGVGSSSIVVIAGTPASSPSAPAVPNNHLKIAEIAVANGETVTTGNVTDYRAQATLGMIAGPEGFLINGKIVPSVSSNNLTVAIKTLAGNDPSAGEPVWCRINNQIRKITSALSVTRNAGTNWFGSGAASLATNEIDYFVYLGLEGSDIRIGFARIPYASLYSQFSGTSTAETYGAFDNNPGSSDTVVNIGRFAATLSATASFNWSIPSFTAINLIQRPIFETRDLTYAPQYTGFSANPTNVVSTYRIMGNYVDLFYRAATSGTSNANTLSFSLPFTVVTLSNYQVRRYSRGTDNGGTVVEDVTYAISSAGTTLEARLNGNASGWTSSNAKKLDWADAIYRIA